MFNMKLNVTSCYHAFKTANYFLKGLSILHCNIKDMVIITEKILCNVPHKNEILKVLQNNR